MRFKEINKILYSVSKVKKGFSLEPRSYNNYCKYIRIQDPFYQFDFQYYLDTNESGFKSIKHEIRNMMPPKNVKYQ